MKSSHRVLKQNQFVLEESSKYIETVLEKETLFEDAELSLDEHSKKQLNHRLSQLTDMEKEAHFLLEKAEKEKQDLLDEAVAEATLLKTQAEQDGYQAGKQQGYQDGHEEGFAQGCEEGLQSIAALKQEAIDQLHTAREEILAYQESKKSDLLQLAIQMAEKIVHHQLEMSQEKIVELIHPQLETLTYEPDMMTLFVHPTQAKWLTEHKDKLERISPGTRFTILSDSQLEEWSYVLESSRFVIEIDIKKQLDAMLEELERL